MAFGMVKTAGSQPEPKLCCKIPVFMYHKLFSIVQEDLFYITIDHFFLFTSIVLRVILYDVAFVILLILWIFFTMSFYPV